MSFSSGRCCPLRARAQAGWSLKTGIRWTIHLKTQIGIPGLLDIPLLNLLFGRRAVSTVRSSLFVLINAKITVVHEEEARLFGT